MLKSTDNFCRQAVLYFIFIWFSVMVFTPNLLVLLASFLSRDPVWMLRLPLISSRVSRKSIADCS